MFLPSLLGAILPTIFLVWLIWWADRYEREPARMLIAAFGWGALPSILLALITELILSFPLELSGMWGQLVSVAVIAPVVEEMAKGLALLGLLWFMGPEIDGILDGIVYGALVGAGFSMTENFFYFLGAEEASTLFILIFLRAGVFGLNHIFYTAVFGAGVGAVARTKSRGVQIVGLLLGLAGAIGLHMFHNAATVLSQANVIFILTSTLLLWSGLVVFLLLVILLLTRERRLIRDYLADKNAPPITETERARLMAYIPPLERFFPSILLPQPARKRAKVYQHVAELAFRYHRLTRAQGGYAEKLTQEIAALQEALDELLAS